MCVTMGALGYLVNPPEGHSRQLAHTFNDLYDEAILFSAILGLVDDLVTILSVPIVFLL